MIPAFIDGVNLSPGGHRCTLTEAWERFGVGGPIRTELWSKLLHLIERAKQCGFCTMILGGSFVTTKIAPGDLDITWFGPSGLNKETAPSPCVELMEQDRSRERFDCDLMYIELSADWPEQVDFFAGQFGWDAKTSKERGTLILELK